VRRPAPKRRRRAPAPYRTVRTLAVDVGATGIKACVLNEHGEPLTRRRRRTTPQPAHPEAVLAAIERVVTPLGGFERVAVGFPGVVRDGVVALAPTLGRKWTEFRLAAMLADRLKRPVRVANDADVQGLGVIAGTGVELVVTLGTGVGTSLFVDGRLCPNLEIGRSRLGDAGRRRNGRKRWNRQLARFIRRLDEIFHFDRLYLGGGNARLVDVHRLPPSVTVVANVNGLVGGVALWTGVPPRAAVPPDAPGGALPARIALATGVPAG